MLSSLLLLVAIASPALAVLVPLALVLSREWDRLFWALALLLAVINVFFFVEGLHTESALGAAFAFVFVGVSFIVFTVPMVARLCVSGATSSQEEQDHYWLDGQSAPRCGVPEAASRPDKLASFLFGSLLGAIIPAMCLIWGAVFARAPGHLVFTLLAVTAVVSGFEAMRRRGLSSTIRQTLAWLAVTSALLIPYGWWTATAVAGAARAVAGSAPFCLQGGGKPISAVIGLSIFTLRERSDGQGIRYDNHALLVIDRGERRVLMNWSYFHRAFREETLVDSPHESARPVIVCTPAADGGLTPL